MTDAESGTPSKNDGLRESVAPPSAGFLCVP